MTAPVWHSGAFGRVPVIGDAPLVWQVRLDDPAVEALAAGAPLRDDDLRDLAGRPQAGMRALRRRLARLLIAKAAVVHPDTVAIGRREGGAPCVMAPAGWHLSVAGRWPLCLIGISRRPLGVDIEPLDAAPPPDDALTPAELAGASPPDRLARWTAKEAHAKLFGVAAQALPEEIDTRADGDLIRAASPAGRSICHLRCGAGAIAAVAVADDAIAP